MITWGCGMTVLTPRHVPESQVTKLLPLSENPVISVFSFQVSASPVTTFHALRLTGVWWGLAHSGCPQYQSLTKQAIEQAATFFSEHPFTFHLSELFTIAI